MERIVLTKKNGFFWFKNRQHICDYFFDCNGIKFHSASFAIYFGTYCEKGVGYIFHVINICVDGEIPRGNALYHVQPNNGLSSAA